MLMPTSFSFLPTEGFDKAGAPTKRYSGLGRPEMEALHEGLKIYGRGLVNVIGDGNCLFRSVSYGIFGNEWRYHSIRACAVRNLCVSGFMGWCVGRLIKSYIRIIRSYSIYVELG